MRGRAQLALFGHFRAQSDHLGSTDLKAFSVATSVATSVASSAASSVARITFSHVSAHAAASDSTHAPPLVALLIATVVLLIVASFMQCRPYRGGCLCLWRAPYRDACHTPSGRLCRVPYHHARPIP